MSFFKSVGGFFGRMFATDKAVERAVDGLYYGLDKLKFTEEEKAELQAKTISEARTVLLEWFKNSQGQNLSRRFIAISIIITWLTLTILSKLVSIIAVFADESRDDLIEVSNILSEGFGAMPDSVALIIGFYFAAPHLSSIVASLGKQK